jgi:DNA invertase Pin-like site-specific DNA recombinase
MSRVAIYLRVSTTEQTTDNQRLELERWAAARGHTVVEVYEDQGISGANGRDKRPAFDRLLKDATRRKFDVLAAWNVDRLGRSLQHLCETLNELHGAGCDLFLHQQGIDTSTAAGRAMFQMLGVFSEFERAMLRERVFAGLARARTKGTRSGKAIGRPRARKAHEESARTALLAGQSVRSAASASKLSVGKVAMIRRSLVEAGQLAA